MNLEDIARKAGVSRSTVSRVLNNERYVSPEVRERVQQVIETEGFRPNAAARTLVTRRSNIIGTAISQTANVFFGDNSYFPMLLQGIAEACNQRDFAMMLWLAESNEKREPFSRRVARDRHADGVIITSVNEDDPLFAYLVTHNRRFVMVETPPRLADQVSYVTVDNVGAGVDVVNHLLAIGRRRIATITGSFGIQDAKDRLAGYRLALTRAGIPIDPNLIQYGHFQYSDGYRCMQKLLPYAPDAVFAGGDTIAIGAMDAIRSAGLRVPEDIAVVGFDDLDVAAQHQLTTISHSVQTVGSTAATLLIDQILGRLEHPHHIIVPTRLIIRRSTVANA